MKAITFNLLAWVMLPIMDGFAKYLSADLPVLQITWARYFFTVAFTFPIMFFFYRNQLKWSDKPKLQFIRGLILLTANICFFYSISVISLAKALTLAFVAPLIVTAFSPVFWPVAEQLHLFDYLYSSYFLIWPMNFVPLLMLFDL